MAKEKNLDAEVKRIIKKQPVRLLSIVKKYIIERKKIFKGFRDEEQEIYLQQIWTEDRSLRQNVHDFLVDLMNNRELSMLDEHGKTFWDKFNALMQQHLIKNKKRISNY